MKNASRRRRDFTTLKIFLACFAFYVVMSYGK